MLEEKKILDHVTSISKTNKKIVFTNGCFDLLHKGHRDLIKQSFSFGDILIVGLNSDESVKRLKGEDRPMQNEVERKNALLNTGYVNEVYIFDDDTPLELIKLIKPDILVKGGDYTVEEIVGHDLAPVHIVPTVENYSTSNTLKRMME